jgi:hypothetical protein
MKAKKLGNMASGQLSYQTESLRHKKRRLKRIRLKKVKANALKNINIKQ